MPQLNWGDYLIHPVNPLPKPEEGVSFYNPHTQRVEEYDEHFLRDNQNAEKLLSKTLHEMLVEAKQEIAASEAMVAGLSHSLSMATSELDRLRKPLDKPKRNAYTDDSGITWDTEMLWPDDYLKGDDCGEVR